MKCEKEKIRKVEVSGEGCRSASDAWRRRLCETKSSGMAAIAAVEAIDDAAGVVGLKLVLLEDGGAAEARLCHSEGRRQQQKVPTAETASRHLTTGC